MSRTTLRSAPALKDLHHLKTPVTDLATSVEWYSRVFGAERRREYDHIARDGRPYAAIMLLPGVTAPLELRLAPAAATAMAGYDLLNISVGTPANLRAWAGHLDSLNVGHSPVITAHAGDLLVVKDPDGLMIRLLTMPDGGVSAIQMNQQAPEPAGPWSMPPLMRRP